MISSFSQGQSNCVDVSYDYNDSRKEPFVVVIDSKFPDGFQLRFTKGEWDAFLEGVRAGEFDYEKLRYQ